MLVFLMAISGLGKFCALRKEFQIVLTYLRKSTIQEKFQGMLNDRGD